MRLKLAVIYDGLYGMDVVCDGRVPKFYFRHAI
jgi:hypothetical protein